MSLFLSLILNCYTYSALDFEALPQCPKESGMGACMFPTSGSDPGIAIGYLMSDIIEEVTGVLRLSYYNGVKCGGENSRNHVVNIYFQCEQGFGMVREYVHILYIVYIYMYVYCICTYM